MDPAAVEKALGKTTASITDKSVAQSKSANTADTGIASKKPGKETDTKVIPPAKSA